MAVDTRAGVCLTRNALSFLFPSLFDIKGVSCGTKIRRIWDDTLDGTGLANAQAITEPARSVVRIKPSASSSSSPVAGDNSSHIISEELGIALATVNAEMP